ncbi:MAG: hypothetical protein ACPGAO_08910 [Flavobacteriaceae bacterium]
MIIHIKTPKTGTTSIDSLANQNLAKDEIFNISKDSKEVFDNMTDSEIMKIKYLTGHYVTKKRIERVKSVIPNTFVFTVFREPVGWIISNYNYKYRNQEQGPILSLFLCHSLRRQVSWYLRIICHKPILAFFFKTLDSNKLYQLMFGQLDVVIPTNYINEAVPRLFFFLGINPDRNSLPRKNVAGSDVPIKLKRTQLLEQTLHKKFKKDQELHDVIISRFVRTFETVLQQAEQSDFLTHAQFRHE